LSSGFATKQFLNFASLSSSVANDGGLFAVKDEVRFPYYKVLKPYAGVNSRFIITPICFSGPYKIDFETFFASIGTAKHSFKGGFLQTRRTSMPSENFDTFGDYHVYFDARVNYRISLQFNDQEYHSSMRRDSRYALRKILASGDDYSLVTFRGNSVELERFAKLYDETAVRVGFDARYRFTASQWKGLLEHDSWDLYLLYLGSSLIGGAVVTAVETGYDYTFIANDPTFRDSSRALLYFVRKELATRSNLMLDIGGGIEEGDSLAHFKRSMGGEPVSFLRCKFGHRELFRDAIHARECLSNHWP